MIATHDYECTPTFLRYMHKLQPQNEIVGETRPFFPMGRSRVQLAGLFSPKKPKVLDLRLLGFQASKAG